MQNSIIEDEKRLLDFLRTPTPEAWINAALDNLPTLLLDHAHCERKAAATALNFISKYPEKEDLIEVMSPLAREELLHFEKVLNLLAKYKIPFSSLKPTNYAQQLHKSVTKLVNQQRLCDQLIIGAIIEARSCERFNALAPKLEDKALSKFYSALVKAEARHFESYLTLALRYGGDINERLTFFLELENRLISTPDKQFRFHSGPPATI